jgi:hypothetical protein
MAPAPSSASVVTESHNERPVFLLTTGCLRATADVARVALLGCASPELHSGWAMPQCRNPDKSLPFKMLRWPSVIGIVGTRLAFALCNIWTEHRRFRQEGNARRTLACQDSARPRRGIDASSCWRSSWR